MREFTVPTKTVSLNKTSGEHWSHRYARSATQKEETFLVWQAELGKWRPELPCTVTLTRIAFSDGLDDHDNLRGALKAVVDAIAAIIGVDDKDKRRVTWVYGQERAPERGYYAVRITIEENTHAEV